MSWRNCDPVPDYLAQVFQELGWVPSLHDAILVELAVDSSPGRGEKLLHLTFQAWDALDDALNDMFLYQLDFTIILNDSVDSVDLDYYALDIEWPKGCNGAGFLAFVWVNGKKTTIHCNEIRLVASILSVEEDRTKGQAACYQLTIDIS